MKFNFALAIHFATLALATRGLGAGYRASSTMLTIAIAAVASAGFEIVYMTVQAARQQPSHFNLSTPFYATMYSLMAVVTIAAGTAGDAAWSDGTSGLGGRFAPRWPWA